MPTAGKVKTRALAFYTGATPTIISCQSDATLEMSTNFATTTCKDSPDGVEEFIPTTNTWSASGTGMFAFDAANGSSALFTAWKTQALTPLVFQTAVTGDKKYSGSAYIESLSFSSTGTNDVATFSYQFKGTGTLTEATVS